VTVFDWGQLIADVIIGALIVLHSHVVYWRRR
jgi:hypothetical protein